MTVLAVEVVGTDKVPREVVAPDLDSVAAREVMVVEDRRDWRTVKAMFDLVQDTKIQRKNKLVNLQLKVQ